MTKYLIIAELDTKGYIIGTLQSLHTAKKKTKKIFELSNQFSFHELHLFHPYLSQYKSYEIKGNALYMGNEKQCISNGLLSIYILEIDSKKFSMEQFIKERESTSLAVVDLDEKLPEYAIYAN